MTSESLGGRRLPSSVLPSPMLLPQRLVTFHQYDLHLDGDLVFLIIFNDLRTSPPGSHPARPVWKCVGPQSSGGGRGRGGGKAGRQDGQCPQHRSVEAPAAGGVQR